MYCVVLHGIYLSYGIVSSTCMYVCVRVCVPRVWGRVCVRVRGGVHGCVHVRMCIEDMEIMNSFNQIKDYCFCYQHI